MNRGGIVEGLKVADVGECRRAPPANDYRWPKTVAGDTCGEWSGKEEGNGQKPKRTGRKTAS